MERAATKRAAASVPHTPTLRVEHLLLQCLTHSLAIHLTRALVKVCSLCRLGSRSSPFGLLFLLLLLLLFLSAASSSLVGLALLALLWHKEAKSRRQNAAQQQGPTELALKKRKVWPLQQKRRSSFARAEGPGVGEEAPQAREPAAQREPAKNRGL